MELGRDAFGMVAQLAFEGKKEELKGLLEILGRLDSIFTLSDIGLTEYEDKKVIADRILAEFKGSVAENHSVEEVIKAFDEADRLAGEYKHYNR